MPAAVIVPPTCTPARWASSFAMRFGWSWSSHSMAMPDESGRDEVGGDQVAEEPEPPQREGHGEDAEARRPPEQLGDAVEHPRRPGARGS